MSNPTVTGQSLLDALRIQLGSLSNAFTVDQQLYFLNLGVSEVWAITRTLDLDYFGTSSQDTTAADDDYFIDLNTTTREYTLPPNCREIRAIECTTESFADRTFELRKIDDPEFTSARRNATASGVGGTTGCYLYTIFGNKFQLADFPEATLRIKLWYIKSIDEIGVAEIPEILFPFTNKITEYAAKCAVLSTQNLEMSVAWKVQWDSEVRILVLSEGPRSSTGPVFISDFLG